MIVFQMAHPISWCDLLWLANVPPLNTDKSTLNYVIMVWSTLGLRGDGERSSCNYHQDLPGPIVSLQLVLLIVPMAFHQASCRSVYQVLSSNHHTTLTEKMPYTHYFFGPD